MSVSLDAGDMLAQEAIDIGPEETAGEVEARLAPLGAKLAVQVIEQIQNGSVQGRKQDPSQVTKAPKLKKENGVIDWNRTAEQVCNQIRAMQPWPTAYTFWHRAGQPSLRLIITKAVPFPVGYDPSFPSGSIIVDEHVGNALVVIAGLVLPEERSLVKIMELQPAGKRRMAAEEFLRGRKPQAGDRLGPETP
jgi:methionyl-tRNA formyltransferase